MRISACLTIKESCTYLIPTLRWLHKIYKGPRPGIEPGMEMHVCRFDFDPVFFTDRVTSNCSNFDFDPPPN